MVVLGQAVVIEQRRRAYLEAMELAVWLPRVPLPYAAPARSWESLPPLSEEKALPIAPSESLQNPTPSSFTPLVGSAPPPALPIEVEQPLEPADAHSASVLEPLLLPQDAEEGVPQCSIQLLWAGSCLWVLDAEPPTPLKSHQALGVLLRDIVRAARLPAPQFFENAEDEARHWVRWPLLTSGVLPQNRSQAAVYLQAVIEATQERAQQSAQHIWLMGPWAAQLVAHVAAEEFPTFRCLPFSSGVGKYWVGPSLATLLSNPQLKPDLWGLISRFLCEE